MVRLTQDESIVADHPQQQTVQACYNLYLALNDALKHLLLWLPWQVSHKTLSLALVVPKKAPNRRV
jgi:hypothetical protein